MKKALGAAGVAIAALSLNGCSQSVTFSMGNPAENHCSKQGGKLRTEKGQGGEFRTCVLRDGSAFQEWVSDRNAPPAK
ncbi:MAG: DUF333 domain-containing protein [Comamonas sp.]|uniref:putative hemolysin n=1 Tax=Comamonas sp. lk TaxID=2201272 RepID=UPI000EAFBF89|nr:DUF333 domain-containing protein [Comamonas sp. lk]